MPSAADLLLRLGIMARRGVLEVARAVATEPRTAGEISALWHIDPTLVNRHLRTLAAAGLARTARRGDGSCNISWTLTLSSHSEPTCWRCCCADHD